MKTLIAYVLAFFLAPIIGAIVALIPGLIVGVLGKSMRAPALLLSFVVNSLLGFAVAWFGFKVFDWLGVARSVWMLVVLGVGMLLNDARRLAAAGAQYMHHDQDAMSTRLYSITLGEFSGHLAGLVAAGVKLL